VTPEGEQESISGLEGEMTDGGLVKQSKELSIDIPTHSDMFNKMDEAGVTAESKLHDASVLSDRQKE
jgi:hypothetical protein